jgi:hypothetical protein
MKLTPEPTVKARVSEEAVRRKGGGGSPRKLGMG